MILKQLNGEIALVYYVSLLSSLLTQHEKCEESEGYWKPWSKRNADTETKVRCEMLKRKRGLLFRKTGVRIGCVVEKKMSGKGQLQSHHSGEPLSLLLIIFIL